jgi:hypothetical protein
MSPSHGRPFVLRSHNATVRLGAILLLFSQEGAGANIGCMLCEKGSPEGRCGMEHSGLRVRYVTEACVVIQQFSEMLNLTLSAHTRLNTHAERQEFYVIVSQQSLCSPFATSAAGPTGLRASRLRVRFGASTVTWWPRAALLLACALLGWVGEYWRGEPSEPSGWSTSDTNGVLTPSSVLMENGGRRWAK